MVHKCCISSCGMSVRVTGCKGLSFHTFPVKEPNREKWLQAVLPHVDKPEMFRIVQGYTRICSRHFKKKDYSLDSRKRARLSSNAVPSGFPGRDIKDAIQPIRLEKTKAERGDNSTKNSVVTICRVEKHPSRAVLAEPTLPGEKEVIPTTSNQTIGATEDQQSQQVSEDDTASSTFSSQEECGISRHHTNTKRKSPDKIRKRRRHRVSMPVPLSSSKKRSSVTEDLNIEGVGDALAEINLSAFMSKSSDLIRGSPNDPQLGKSPPFQTIKVEPLFLRPLEPAVKPKSHVSNSTTPILRPKLNEGTFLGTSSPKKECLAQANFEHDLLMSIHAVSIGANETPDPQSPRSATPTREVDSVSLNNFLSSTDDDDSFVSSHLQDLYADLVNGGASLSLEDSTATIFDSQLLIDALQGVAEDLAGDASIDQLARNLDDSFLNDALAPPSILGIDDIPISNLVSFTSALPDLDSKAFDATTLLQSINSNECPSDGKAEAVPTTSGVKSISDPDSSQKRITEESESSPEFDEQVTPTRSRKKLSQREKAAGSFSVERFRDSDKDIEYYTGFQTFEKFNSFFSSIESYAENLKVTDMVYGVANLGLNVSPEGSAPVTGDAALDVAVENISSANQEPKRRLSQGRSMSRMDEMFMTIIRLRRKIPEKVVGHMFCISQPSVSRIIRAWTMLLSRILSLGNEGKCTASKTNNRDYLPGSMENTADASSSMATTESPNQSHIKTDDIPASFRHLFQSELAQSIISSGTVTLNSRKTCSSTKCPNTSRSKRPKKEKVAVAVSADVVPPSLSSQDVPIVNDKFSTVLIPPSIESEAGNEGRHTDSEVVAPVVDSIM